MKYCCQLKLSIRFVVLLLLILCSAGLCAAQTPTPLPHSDLQSWNDLQFTVPLNKEVDLILLGTLRIGRNISHPVDERAGVNFKFNVGKYLALQPGYLYIRMQPVAGLNFSEHRLSFAATPRIPFKHFTLTDRNMFERRIRNPQVDSTRYRNRLQVEIPIKKNSTWLPFASDEIFYDWSVDHWVRNRFSVGVKKTFSKKFAVDFYYLRQNDGRSRPGDLNVIGTVFRVSR
jgi:uncharacterized protein DUF2490